MKDYTYIGTFSQCRYVKVNVSSEYLPWSTHTYLRYLSTYLPNYLKPTLEIFLVKIGGYLGHVFPRGIFPLNVKEEDVNVNN